MEELGSEGTGWVPTSERDTSMYLVCTVPRRSSWHCQPRAERGSHYGDFSRAASATRVCWKRQAAQHATVVVPREASFIIRTSWPVLYRCAFGQLTFVYQRNRILRVYCSNHLCDFRAPPPASTHFLAQETMFVPKVIAFAAFVNARSISERVTDGSNPSGTIPPDTIADCTYWVNVEDGDSCQSITSTYGIPPEDFYQYNPSIKGDCSGLTVGYSYCIEVNYGLGPPEPTMTAAPTTTSITSSLPTNTSASGPSPTQSGIADDCINFYQVQSGDYCQAIVEMYGTFTLEDFNNWNPAVGEDCSHLFTGYYVCVGVPGTPTARTSTSLASPTPTGPSPTQTGIIDTCTQYYKAVSGDSCYAIADRFGTFTVDQFADWNPAVQKDCSKLFVGYYYCVSVPGTPTARPTTTSASPTPTGPSPTQSGIIDTCIKYYKAESGDNCAAISNKFGTFSTAQFISWNPAVKPDCSKLFVGYYYCIAVPGTPTTPTTTSTKPTPTQNGPQPQQSGITKDCNRFYKVVNGDSCYNIEQQFHISASEFNSCKLDRI